MKAEEKCWLGKERDEGTEEIFVWNSVRIRDAIHAIFVGVIQNTVAERISKLPVHLQMSHNVSTVKLSKMHVFVSSSHDLNTKYFICFHRNTSSSFLGRPKQIFLYKTQPQGLPKLFVAVV